MYVPPLSAIGDRVHARAIKNVPRPRRAALKSGRCPPKNRSLSLKVLAIIALINNSRFIAPLSDQRPF